MALTKNQPATFKAQLTGASAPVSATVDGTAMGTAPAFVAGTDDTYLFTLTAAEMNAATRYLLVTDALGNEYGITVVTDETPSGLALETTAAAAVAAANAAKESADAANRVTPDNLGIAAIAAAVNTTLPEQAAANKDAIIAAIPGAVPIGYVRVTHETLGTDGEPLGRVAAGAIITAYQKPDLTVSVEATEPATSVGAWYIDLPPDALWKLEALAADYRPDITEVQT